MKRWVEISEKTLSSDNALGQISDDYHAAWGHYQRAVRWCRVHDAEQSSNRHFCWRGFRHDPTGRVCVFSDAIVIVPPREERAS